MPWFRPHHRLHWKQDFEADQEYYRLGWVIAACVAVAVLVLATVTVWLWFAKTPASKPVVADSSPTALVSAPVSSTLPVKTQIKKGGEEQTARLHLSGFKVSVK